MTHQPTEENFSADAWTERCNFLLSALARIDKKLDLLQARNEVPKPIEADEFEEEFDI